LSPAVLDAAGSGPVIICHNSTTTVIERIAITGGFTPQWGAGALLLLDSQLSLMNVTIAGNNAQFGGAAFGINSELVIMNSILWDNGQPQIYLTGDLVPGTAVITYSDIQGGVGGIEALTLSDVFWADGNLDEDPLFIGEFCLHADSPCIDSGIQDIEILYNNDEEILIIPPLFFLGSAPDMGACENPFLMGDIDGNGSVNIVDIVMLVDFILATEPDPYQFMVADMDYNGELNIVDIVLMVDVILSLDD